MKSFCTWLCIVALSSVALPLRAQWQSLGSGIATAPRKMYSISVPNPQTVWGITIHPQVTTGVDEVTLSVDGGDSWTPGNVGIGDNTYTAVHIFGLDARTAWVTLAKRTDRDQPRIYKTANAGGSWTEQTGPFNAAGHGVLALHFFDSNTGVAYGSNQSTSPTLRIYRTENGGSTWVQLPDSVLPGDRSGERVSLFSGNGAYEAIGDQMWFGTSKGRVLRSSDRGATWTAHATGLGTSKNVASVAFRDAQHGLCVVDNGNLAARTSDGGLTWQAVTFPQVPTAAAVEYVPNTPGTYIVHDGTFNLSSFAYTQNEGNTWESLDIGVSMDCIQFFSPTQAYGGATVVSALVGGVYAWTDNWNTLDIGADLAASLLYLAPNPARDRVALRWTETQGIPPRPGDIDVIDMQGRRIAVPVAAHAPWDLTLDLAALAPGLYLVQVRTGEVLHRARLRVE
ncbi:MAG: hypothetical protein OHK0039_06400 [Bacteroidia bacterium]